MESGEVKAEAEDLMSSDEEIQVRKRSRQEKNQDENKNRGRGQSNVSEKEKEEGNVSSEKEKSKVVTKRKRSSMVRKSRILAMEMIGRLCNESIKERSKRGKKNNNGSSNETVTKARIGLKKDENGFLQSNMCHQCQRNDKGEVVRCTKCKTKRYCLPCMETWYAPC